MHKHCAWNQDKQMQKADWFDAKRGWRTKNKVSRQPTDPYSKPNIGKPAQRSLACKCYSILKKSLQEFDNSTAWAVWFCIDNQSGDGRANGDFKTSLEDWINGLVIHSVEKQTSFHCFHLCTPEKWCSVERTILDDWCVTRGQTRTRNTQRHYQSQQGLEILQSDSRLIITHWERERAK